MDRYPDIKSRFEVLVEKVGRKARLAIIRRKGRNVIRKTGKRTQGRICQRIEDIEGGARSLSCQTRSRNWGIFSKKASLCRFSFSNRK
jgi:hypothetical protein